MIKPFKFQKKLLVYNTALMIVIMFAVIGVFYNYSVKEITKRVVNDFEVITSKTVAQLDKLIYDMDRTALQIAANPNILYYFSRMDKNPEENYFVEEPAVASEIVKLLNSYNFKKNSNLRICLYNDYHDFVYSASAMTTLTAIEAFFTSDNFYATQEYFGRDNVFSMYRQPQADILNDTNLPSPNIFSVVREIKDYSSNSNKVGYIEVQQSVDYIDDIIKDLGEASYSLILDDQNHIIYQSSTVHAATAPTNIEAIIQKVDENTLSQGINFYEDAYIFVENLEDYNLKAVFIKQQNIMLEPLIQFRNVLILACIMIGCIVLVTEMIMTKRFTRPLVELSHSIKEINIDNLKLDMATTHETDELQQLKVVFNKMLLHLNQSIKKQIVSETNELKSHLFVLQSQMNPHFIYNILGIISIEAQQYGNMKTVNMCTKLSRMLSFSSHMGDGFCRLSEEVKNAENYLALMKERYEELFEYKITLDSDIKDILVPKLIIQPICENCFKHGFKHIEPVWKIDIRVFTKEQKWYVEIRDNGQGFDEDKLVAYERMIQETTIENVKEKIEESAIGGLCIPNTFIRLKLSYDEAYVFKLDNTNSGAKVQLGGAIEYMKGRKDND